ncbi:MAG TPA: caspase family protein [Patescibacteria group bacterium]|nr:caspase family protein [Patescibacteria group bacterium]
MFKIKISVILSLFFISTFFLLSQDQLSKLVNSKNSWALIIGISKYKNVSMNLQYADKDARLFHDSLIKFGSVPKDHIKLVLNENANRESIRKYITGWLNSNSKKDDKVIIFFSGHGTQDIDDDNDEEDGFDEFIVPNDYDDNDITSAIRDDEFAYWVSKNKSENILVVFDSCYSGGAAKAKGLLNKKIKGEIKIDDFIKDIYRNIPKNNISILGACKANQISFESAELKQGVFTFFLVDSFKKESDLNFDHNLSLNEIFNVIKPKILKFTKEKFNREQEPVLITNKDDLINLIELPIEIDESKKSDIEKKSIQNQLNLLKVSGYSYIEILEKEVKLKEALVLADPENYEAYIDLGNYYRRNQEFQKSKKNYEIAHLILKNKSSFISEYYLSTVCQSLYELYREIGDINKAKNYLFLKNNYIKKSNQEEVSKYEKELGDLFFLENDFDQALTQYHLSLSKNKIQNEIYNKLAMTYIAKKEYDFAKTIIEKGFEINSNSKELQYLLSVLFKYVDNDQEKYEQIFNKYVENNSFYSDYLKNKKLLDEYLSIQGNEKSIIILLNNMEQKLIEGEFVIEIYIDYAKYCNKFGCHFDRSKNYLVRLKKFYPFLTIEKP